MTAVFPNGIKAFTTKKNLIDDVEASHVNDIQNEITSIEETLGERPTVIEQALPDMKTRDYGTVGHRLDIVETGHHIPVVRLRQEKVYVKDRTYTFVNFDRYNDPYGHYNLSDITVKAPGWWVFTTHCWWSDEPSYNGYRLIRLEQNGTTHLQDMKPARMQGACRDIQTHLSWMGMAHVGDRFRVRLYQNSGVTVKAHAIWLNAYLIRFYDPTLF